MGDDAPDYDAALPGAPTELAPSATETEAHTAWALDDGPEWRPPFWTAGRITAAVVGVAVVAAIGVAGVAGYQLNEEPVAVPSSTIVQPAPETVTVTPDPPRRGGWAVVSRNPTVTKHGGYSDAELYAFDREFLDRLSASGWTVTNAQFLAAVGKGVCTEYALGTSMARVTEMLRANYSPSDADALVATAQIVYPDCVPAA